MKFPKGAFRLWLLCFGGAVAAFGLAMSGLAGRVMAQWHGLPWLTMGRGMMAHSILNKGWGAHRDNGKKQEPSGFSYPAARNLRVYSGGAARAGWNHKIHSAGDGIWVMSNTGGTVNIAYGGTNIDPHDIASLEHDVRTYPEAYLGATHHPDWALSMRDADGVPVAWTQGPNLLNDRTNYWPAQGNVIGGDPLEGEPVVIWNYHWNAYKDGRPFSERVAVGEFDPLSEPSWASSLSSDEFPDVIGIQKAESSLHNLRWTRRWAQYGHADYDDFLIQETVIENVGSETQTGVYAAVKNRFLHASEDSWFDGAVVWHALSGDRLPADDWNRSTLAPNYLQGVAPLGRDKPAGLPRGVDLADRGHGMIYMHDGDQQKVGWIHDDWGGPWIREQARSSFVVDFPWVNEGFMNHPDYFGVGVVDAFPPFNTYGGLDPESYVPPHDNPLTAIDESLQQPASATIWQFRTHNDFDQPDPGKDSDFRIYDALTLAGYPPEPEQNEMYTNFMTFGPWDLGPGEKAKFVIAYVGGMGGHNEKYDDYRTFAEPFLFAYMNLYNGRHKGITTFRERQAEIPYGEEAMFDHLERAIQVYDWGYDVPNQPPNIRLAYDSNLKGQVELRWSASADNARDPDYTGAEAEDIAGYRLYRSTSETEGPFELLREFSLADARAGNLPAGLVYEPLGVFHTVKSSAHPVGIPLRERSDVGGASLDAGPEVAGMYCFTDTQTKPGFPYYYSVRTYDTGHADWKGTGAVPSFESAPGPAGVATLGRAVTGSQSSGLTPVVPSNTIFNRLEEDVRVVPNPFKIDDTAHSYQGQTTIRFINLPSRCQIDIYDVAGHLVWTMFNNDEDRGELSWEQETFGNIGASSGVISGTYFWKVTSLMPESMEEFQTGTLVVIR